MHLSKITNTLKKCDEKIAIPCTVKQTNFVMKICSIYDHK